MHEILNNIPIRWNYKKWRIEKGFQSEVFTYLRNREYFCYHIADIGMGYRLLDAYILDPKGNQFLIEFKKTDGFTFNMNQFEPSQIELLDLMQERWALSYIMVYSQKTNTYWVGKYSYLKSNANSKWWIKLF